MKILSLKIVGGYHGILGGPSVCLSVKRKINPFFSFLTHSEGLTPKLDLMNAGLAVLLQP